MRGEVDDMEHVGDVMTLQLSFTTLVKIVVIDAECSCPKPVKRFRDIGEQHEHI